MFYDMMLGSYHVGRRPRFRTFVGFSWNGQYYVHNCLPFGLSTAPWVFLKVVMSKLFVMYRNRGGISVLPSLAMKQGF